MSALITIIFLAVLSNTYLIHDSVKIHKYRILQDLVSVKILNDRPFFLSGNNFTYAELLRVRNYVCKIYQNYYLCNYAIMVSSFIALSIDFFEYRPTNTFFDSHLLLIITLTWLYLVKFFVGMLYLRELYAMFNELDSQLDSPYFFEDYLSLYGIMIVEAVVFFIFFFPAQIITFFISHFCFKKRNRYLLKYVGSKSSFLDRMSLRYFRAERAYEILPRTYAENYLQILSREYHLMQFNKPNSVRNSTNVNNPINENESSKGVFFYVFSKRRMVIL